MSYLSNAAVNRLNIHSALHILAINLAGNFFMVFLLTRGFSAIEVLLSLMGLLLLRAILRPMMLWIAPRLGSRWCMVIGIVLYAAEYLMLTRVHGFDLWFVLYGLAFAFGDIFYWLIYHAVFAMVGDQSHRGKQLGVRQALATLSGIFAPLIGGWALDFAGANVTFGLGALIELLSIIPLLCVPSVPFEKIAPAGAYKAGVPGGILFATDGCINISFIYVWGIALFNAGGESFTIFGGAVAIAGLVAAIGILFMGKIMDGSRAHHALLPSSALIALAILMEVFGAHQGGIGVMVAIAAVGAPLGVGYGQVLMTNFYNMVKRAPCPLRFQYVAEGGWDIGCSATALLGALLLYMGAGMGAVIALALIGLCLQTLFLRSYFTRKAEPLLDADAAVKLRESLP